LVQKNTAGSFFDNLASALGGKKPQGIRTIESFIAIGMRWHRQTQRNSPKKCDGKFAAREIPPPPHTHKKSHKNRFFSVLGSFAKYTPFTFLAFKDCKKPIILGNMF
jgi:hypothetical protein